MNKLTYRIFYGANLYHIDSCVQLNFRVESIIIQSWFEQRQALVQFLNGLPKINIHIQYHETPDLFLTSVLNGLMNNLINCMYGTKKVIKIDIVMSQQTGCIIYELIDERLIEETHQVMAYLLTTFLDEIGELSEKNQIAKTELENFYNRVKRLTPDINHYLFMVTAKERNIPYYWLHNYSWSVTFIYGQGCKQQPLNAARSNKTSRIGVGQASNKEITKDLLLDIRLPAPRNAKTRNIKQVYQLAKEIGFPVVVKPLDGNGGRDVVVNLTDKKEIIDAAENIIKKNQMVLIEEYIPGDDFRILVVNGKVAGVVRKNAAHVTGNGKNSISELIEIANQDPRRGGALDRNLMINIPINAVTHQLLRQQGLTLDSVPPNGMIVRLASACNLHSGGTAVDAIDQIHPDNIEMAIRAAQQIGLDIAGIDYITPDISISFRQLRSGICEVNSQPGLDIHAVAENNQNTRCAKLIMNYLFPNNDNGRVPSLFVLDDHYPSKAMDFLRDLFACVDIKTGVWEQGWLYIDNKLLGPAVSRSIDNVRTLARDPWSETLLFECYPEKIIREGLGLDLCTASLILGIESLPDKDAASVFEILQKASSGVLIINADCEQFIPLIKRYSDSDFVLLTCRSDNAIVKDQIELGKKTYAAFVVNGKLHIVAYADHNSRYLGSFSGESFFLGDIWQSVIIRLIGSIAAFELLTHKYVSHEWLIAKFSSLRFGMKMRSELINLE